MAYKVYTVTLPEHPEAILFVQGIIARNRAGFMWMWRNLFWFRKSNASAEGCIQVKAGICSKNEVMLVSYWKDIQSLGKFYKSEPHQKMMKYMSENPDNLTLYNETYRPSRSGKYINEPNGLAVIYPKANEVSSEK